MGCLRMLILLASTRNLFCKKKKKWLNTLFDGFKWITFDEIAFFFLKMLARSSLKGGYINYGSSRSDRCRDQLM